jgi:hypothetical protein
MFAGIDVASERHWLARLDDAGQADRQARANHQMPGLARLIH